MTQITVQTYSKKQKHTTSAFGPDPNKAQQSTRETPQHPPRHQQDAEGRGGVRKTGLLAGREQGLLGEWRVRSSDTVHLHASADQHMLE